MQQQACRNQQLSKELACKSVQVLNGVNLASFSLVDCAQTLLGQRLEVVPPPCLAAWARLTLNPNQQ